MCNQTCRHSPLGLSVVMNPGFSLSSLNVEFSKQKQKAFKKNGRMVDPVLPPLFPLVSFIKIELILLFPYGCAVLLGVAVASGIWDR